MSTVANMWTVYGLRDLRSGSFRYVGTTRQDLGARLRHHESSWRTFSYVDKAAWIYSMRQVSIRPDIVELERKFEPMTRGACDSGEADWIAKMLLRGEPLLNARNLYRARASMGWLCTFVCTTGQKLLRVIHERKLTLGDAGEEMDTTASRLSGLMLRTARQPTDEERETICKWTNGAVSVTDSWGEETRYERTFARPKRPYGELRCGRCGSTEHNRSAHD